MSLMSNWKERRKMFARTTGRPLWFLIGVLIVVVVFIYYLGNLENTLVK
jgi:predicted nucleic acid-binding Zn ribbon protein